MGNHLSKYQIIEDYNNNEDTHVKPHISYIVNPTKKMIYIPKIKLITFYADNIEYQTEEGMTWEEWINSGYNTDGFYISEYNNYKYVFFSNGDFIVEGSNGILLPNVIIKPINYSRFKHTGGGLP